MDDVPGRKKVNLFDRTIETISMGILALMVVEVGFSVFCRYLFSLTFRWSEEVTIILFVYLIFLAVPIVMNQRLHICIDFFVQKLPAKACRFLNILVELIIAIVSLILVTTSVQVVLHIGMEPMSATYLPIGTIYGAVGLSGLLLFIITIRAFIRQFRSSSGCEDPQ